MMVDVSRSRLGRRALAVLTWMTLVAPAQGVAQSRLTQTEALELAFPLPARVERRTAFLTDQELDAARARAGRNVEISDRIVSYYLARSDGAPRGVAYFDAHLVRTLREVIMVVVSPEDRIDRIEILRFAEPPEYRAPESWLRQFDGSPLTDELSLKGGIVNLTGATLTSRAVTRAARRVLALHHVIDPWQRGEERH